jgi:hypothetical protein
MLKIRYTQKHTHTHTRTTHNNAHTTPHVSAHTCQALTINSTATHTTIASISSTHVLYHVLLLSCPCHVISCYIMLLTLSIMLYVTYTNTYTIYSCHICLYHIIYVCVCIYVFRYRYRCVWCMCGLFQLTWWCDAYMCWNIYIYASAFCAYCSICVCWNSRNYVKRYEPPWMRSPSEHVMRTHGGDGNGGSNRIKSECCSFMCHVWCVSVFQCFNVVLCMCVSVFQCVMCVIWCAYMCLYIYLVCLYVRYVVVACPWRSVKCVWWDLQASLGCSRRVWQISTSVSAFTLRTPPTTTVGATVTPHRPTRTRTRTRTPSKGPRIRNRNRIREQDKHHQQH